MGTDDDRDDLNITGSGLDEDSAGERYVTLYGG